MRRRAIIAPYRMMPGKLSLWAGLSTREQAQVLKDLGLPVSTHDAGPVFQKCLVTYGDECVPPTVGSGLIRVYPGKRGTLSIAKVVFIQDEALARDLVSVEICSLEQIAATIKFSRRTL